ncbi:hypothetical protein FDP41_011698 [Naegleria fowleri]|uniref:Uncharacterized protein n=1 Tax=Naegleria fowleri TaxID=5763 RepID=A0A6A5BX48_NAEFO|nr:uncharacterized protein FDP41_011698 [Naegleria fowleri]KAF0981837.1 hypothetical protein FDP41_011698 [Naegleria fowleri]CAG4714424.1 unnamed protein product [Naegleria fowleri]
MWKTFDPSLRVSVNESFEGKHDEAFFSFDKSNENSVIKCCLPQHDLGPHLTNVFLSNARDEEKLISYERVVKQFVYDDRRPFKSRFGWPVDLFNFIFLLFTVTMVVLGMTVFPITLFSMIGIFGTVVLNTNLYYYDKFKCMGMHYFVTNHRLVIVESMNDCYNIYYLMLQDIERVWMNEDDKLMAEIHDEKHGFVKGVLLERVSDHQFYLNALSN